MMRALILIAALFGEGVFEDPDYPPLTWEEHLRRGDFGRPLPKIEPVWRPFRRNPLTDGLRDVASQVTGNRK